MNDYIIFNAATETGGENVIEVRGVIVDDDGFWEGVDSAGRRQVREKLEAFDGDIRLIIDSEGGDVFAGLGIYDELIAYRERTGAKISARISFAASAATLVAMAADHVSLSPAAMFMVHKPWTIAAGNENDFDAVKGELRGITETMIGVYQTKSPLTRDELYALIDGREGSHQGTWLYPDEAVEYGFADEVLTRAPHSAQNAYRGRVAACARRFEAPKDKEEPKQDMSVLLDYYKNYFGEDD